MMIEKIKQKLKKYWRWFLITICGVGIALAAPTLPDTVQEAFDKSDLKDKYEFVTDKLITKTEHIDDIKIAVSSLAPEMTLSKWDGEVDIKIKPKGAKDKKPVFEGEKIKYKENKKEYHLYEVKKGDETYNGATSTIDAYEFEVILLEKPSSNLVEFDIVTKGLDFFYQPELTQEEIDNGASRPENVIGSYAVYHKSKQGDYSKMGKKNYRAGKAFHIYRPKIIDSAGIEVWGKLNITDNLLTVEIPQEFLDNAVYPIRHAAGLTFGYESIGSSTMGSGNAYLWGYVDSPGENGNADSISWYGRNPGAGINCKCALYKDSDDSFVAETEEKVAGSSFAWQQYNFSGSPSILSTTDYVIVVWNDSGFEDFLKFDTASGPSRYDMETYGSWPTPASFTDFDNKFSIYCTYTAGGAEEEAPVQDVIWFD